MIHYPKIKNYEYIFFSKIPKEMKISKKEFNIKNDNFLGIHIENGIN